MNITIIQGHPDGSARHLCHALADEYAAGAVAAGHAVRVIDLGKAEFPLLRTKEAFESGASLPPALQSAPADVAWAEHVVLVYPLWLGEMPALVKGFFEHVLRPGFAYEIVGHGWKPKLRGKSARVVVTMGMPAAFYRWYYGAHSLKSLRRNILSFVGMKPVRATLFGLVDGASAKRRQRWLAKLRELGAAAA